MSLDSAATIETPKQSPVIDVRYERIKAEDCIMTIDGPKLSNILKEAGYPSSVIMPLVITDNIPMHPEALAGFDPYDKTVKISHVKLVEDVRRVYSDLLTRIGEQSPQSISEPNDVLSRVMRSKTFRTLFPVFWPYNMLKNQHVPFFQGNTDRYINYFKAAKNGTLMPGKPLQEQRDRAKKHLSKMMELAMQSSTGWILAHEYEHANKHGKKLLTIAALGALPVVAGSSILLAIDSGLRQQGQMLSPEASLVGIITMLGGLLYGVAKGRSLDEQASYDAGFNNFSRVMQCFNINHEVFRREVLGEPQQITEKPS